MLVWYTHLNQRAQSAKLGYRNSCPPGNIGNPHDAVHTVVETAASFITLHMGFARMKGVSHFL